MQKFVTIISNSYFDSVSLMALGSSIEKELNLEDIQILMGTEMNKEMLIDAGYPESEINPAKSNDCIIAVSSKDLEKNDLIEKIKALMFEEKTVGDKNNSIQDFRTLNEALEQNNDINLVVISTPGEYAYREANKALDLNKNVLIFSDNVSLEKEKLLKVKANEKGLLVMGPDCGTSIIANKGLCFANEISKGTISLIGASGTGLQETTVLIDRMGGGIRHAIGVGGRDLSLEINGISTFASLELLSFDPLTEVIVIVSKPPSESVVDKIVDKCKNINKPVVLCFIDYSGKTTFDNLENVHFVKDFVQAASLAVSIQTQAKIEFKEESSNFDMDILLDKFSSDQKYLRGLYCGGTLCAEALSIVKNSDLDVLSNISKDQKHKLKDAFVSESNSLLDLGEDEFTHGKPHPMIDPNYRNERIIQEASDKETAVILLDFELGYGSNTDPVGVAIESLVEAKDVASKLGNNLQFVAYILGTDKDFQNYDKSKAQLEDLGVILANTNREAVRIAKSIIEENNRRRDLNV